MQGDGQQTALIRFDSPSNAEAALQNVPQDGKVEIAGNPGTPSMLHGEGEKALYERMVCACHAPLQAVFLSLILS